uniref:BTB domain-containing protein n=1 Tax=Panagrolaimus sp. ES5 TaxID=591445 RepID=A0AC34GNZ7_9BILA
MISYKLFHSQNPETGKFDVTFKIDGKKLHAHLQHLALISHTFESMLSDRWNTAGASDDGTIPIKDYSFEDFKQLLTFIYSGECNLTMENIFTMVDMAEFYQINVFKNACVEFLSNIQLTLQNIFPWLELANKYSLEGLKESINNYISKALRLEEMFEEAYKWAENRAMEKQKVDESLNMNEAIKKDLSDILPLINFKDMSEDFLLNFVVRKSFFCAGPELSDILDAARDKVYVRVFDINGKMMKGVLDCPDIDKVVDVIKSQKDICSNMYFWETRQEKPTAPSKLTINEKTEWLLVYDIEGDLALRRPAGGNQTDYILAEMVAEDGFHPLKCKIEVYQYHV